MLISLSIRNFVLIEDAVLELAPGLTVLSGETGAGKTLLTQALGLLLGERAADGLVGEAGDEATIEAVFALQPEDLSGLDPDTAELLDLAGGELVATRRLHRTGRNRCYLNGTAVTLATMAEVLGGLVSFSGQHEHRRLLEPAYQRVVLDAFAGEHAQALLREYRVAWEHAREAARRLKEEEQVRDARDRERELLTFQVEELRAAALSPEEEGNLEAEQRLLARAEEVLRAGSEAAALLRAEDDTPDVGSLLAAVRSRLTSLGGLGPDLDAAAAEVEEAAYLLDDAAHRLRAFLAGVQIDPGRLREVEERLLVYSELARKYGGSTEAALAFLEEKRQRLAELEQAESDLASLVRDHQAWSARALELAAALTSAREQAAPRLEQAVEIQLRDLGMSEARLLVVVESRPGWDGLGPTGADTVEFQLAAHPGLPARSLARTASGGELSRTLLAIKCALAGLEGGETLVFDEIDAGIGGRTATAVGRKLWELSRQSQLVVITHLPQVAAFAERHVLIEKQSRADTAVTRVTALDPEAAARELSRMMGGEPGDPAALAHARTLRDRAATGLID
ncbi:MAG: DNA repair protein RecN [Thermoleophilia bacterium]